MRRNSGLFLIALLAMLLIVLASLLDGEDKRALHLESSLHPWFHLLAFGIVSLVLMVAVRSPRQRAAVLSTLALLAWGTEFVEHVRGNFPIERLDLLADSIGVLLGMLLVSVRRSGF